MREQEEPSMSLRRSLRRAVIGSGLVFLLACDKGPAAPTAPPPPDIRGNWTGALLISFMNPLTGEPEVTVCGHEWTVTHQEGSNVAGQFRGSSVNGWFPRPGACNELGAFSGTYVGFDRLTVSPPLFALGASIDCSLIERPTFVGSGINERIKLEASDVIECLVTGRPTRVARRLTLDLYFRRTRV